MADKNQNPLHGKGQNWNFNLETTFQGEALIIMND